MTKISRFKLNPKDLEHLLNELWEDLASLDEPEAIQTFLKPFFSPTESIMFAKRLEILKLLRLDEPYHEIRNRLKVTPTTIAKMNNILHNADPEFLEVLDRLIEQQKDRKKSESKKRERHHPSKRFWPM